MGETWDLFFEPQCDGISSKDYIFNFCQHRPRDVLTYCSMAVDSAQRFRRPKIAPDDLKDARRRFSQSRFKDLGDEYSENYPQIQVVLSKFPGLYKDMSTAALGRGARAKTKNAGGENGRDFVESLIGSHDGGIIVRLHGTSRWKRPQRPSLGDGPAVWQMREEFLYL